MVAAYLIIFHIGYICCWIIGFSWSNCYGIGWQTYQRDNSLDYSFFQTEYSFFWCSMFLCLLTSLLSPPIILWQYWLGADMQFLINCLQVDFEGAKMSAIIQYHKRHIVCTRFTMVTCPHINMCRILHYTCLRYTLNISHQPWNTNLYTIQMFTLIFKHVYKKGLKTCPQHTDIKHVYTYIYTHYFTNKCNYSCLH